MSTLRSIWLLTALAAGLTVPVFSQAQTTNNTNPPVRLVIVGDSTVCNWPDQDSRRGWGMFIQECFNEHLKVINLAKSGRSTKTFITEGLWAGALKEKPRYVLIQFGHNDSHDPGKPEATDASTTYKEYLRQYIDETRAVGAEPVLVTPMCRRTFTADGKLNDTLLPYANAMKAVALEKKVPLVDLHSESAQLLEKLGQSGSDALANKPGDNTHFNEKGARAMATLVMKQLPLVEPSLDKYLK